ncbi:hypothetical protein [Paenibacillus residui]|uniref:Serine hydroxymethyltransferase-like domain-containing protein n=1 Tax=Paenibacillus residui TaxID=629724 RepID=A0ABW3D6P0_9BACL
MTDREEHNHAEFKSYVEKTINNSLILEVALMDEGLTVASGGTDNHIVLVDLR